MKYIIVLAAVMAVIYVQAEPADKSAPQQTVKIPTTDIIPPVISQVATSEVAEAQRNKRAPILLGKALLGGAVLGKAALGAGVLGAGVLGAGALGAGVVGAGVLGAGALGAGALGAGLYKTK